jgi:ribonuclease R
MRDHLVRVFDGSISSVKGYGLFVALDDLYVEGLVHVSELGADYYHFDPAKHMMLGERTGKRYRLGDRVRVKVVRVDMESTKIDFVLESVTAHPADEGIDVGAWGVAPPKKAKKTEKSGKAGKRHG